MYFKRVLQELRLIYANSDTRKLTSAEISKQAERVEMLLYQLKKEGYEFPGRMRDHVAEACKVSKSKLSRLKVIRENLIPRFTKFYEKGELSEATAYVLAQQSEDVQQLVLKYPCKIRSDFKYYSEHSAENDIKKIKAVLERPCCKQAGGPLCSHCDVLLEKIFDDSYSYKPCDRMCCDKCDKLATCKTACPLLAEKAKKLKADASAQRKQEALAKEERDRPIVTEIKTLWNRFGEARAAANKSIKAYYTALGLYYSKSDNDKIRKLECLEGKFTAYTELPYGYRFRLADWHGLVRLADLLGCSLDYLLCRTDNPAVGESAARAKDETEKWVHLNYIDGFRKPTKFRQDAVALFRLEKGEAPIRMIATWINGAWHISPDGALIDAECVGWFPLPEEDGHEDT